MTAKQREQSGGIGSLKCTTRAPLADQLSALDVRAPRYTSHPTADRFAEDIGAEQYREQLQTRSVDSPLSLYLHIPSCESFCYYCGSSKLVTR